MNKGIILLAGGEAKRFGYPKPFLPYDSEKTFIEKIIDTYLEFDISEMILVLNSKFLNFWYGLKISQDKRIKLKINEHSQRERFYSVKCGIEILNSNIDYCFLQNTDNPFVTSSLLNSLYINRKEDGYTIPIVNGRGAHPILISKIIINFIKQLKTYDINLKDILKKFTRNEIKSDDEKLLLNINTEEDYKLYFEHNLLSYKSI